MRVGKTASLLPVPDMALNVHAEHSRPRRSGVEGLVIFKIWGEVVVDRQGTENQTICKVRRTLGMAARKSYLIIGRLPTSALFTSIQSKHDITHVPTKDLKRADVIARISQLSQKSYTFALLVSETQHIYPIDETLMGTITVECLCKVGAGFDPIDVDYFTSKGTWVANAPNAVRIPTAEWCVALILATVKGIGVADRHVRRGLWRSELGFQSNIQGMSLGIVGLGAIGKVHVP